MSDAIEIRGLRVLGRHGVLAEERERPQPFEIDLALQTSTAAAASSDELADTVDYGAVVVAVRDLVASTSHRLLESLAGAVAEVVLADRRVEEVTVDVRKVRPPVAADVASVGVHLTRRRDEG